MRGGHRPTRGAPQPSGSPWRVHFWHLPLADPQFIVIAQMGTNVGWPGTSTSPVYVGNSTMQTGHVVVSPPGGGFEYPPAAPVTGSGG